MAFFEEIGKHITGVGQNVAQQTKNLADVTQLNNMISEKEKKISHLFMTIGQAYYENHNKDQNAEQLDAINEVNVLYAEIAESREKINQIKGISKCENCGANVPLNAAFCNECGAKIVTSDNAGKILKQEYLCPVCNGVIAAGNLFCSHCGSKLENMNE